MAACKGVNIPSGVIVLARLNCSFMMLTAGRPSLHGCVLKGCCWFFEGEGCLSVGARVCRCTCGAQRLTLRCFPLPSLTDPGAH